MLAYQRFWAAQLMKRKEFYTGSGYMDFPLRAQIGAGDTLIAGADFGNGNGDAKLPALTSDNAMDYQDTFRLTLKPLKQMAAAPSEVAAADSVFHLSHIRFSTDGLHTNGTTYAAV